MNDRNHSMRQGGTGVRRSRSGGGGRHGGGGSGGEGRGEGRPPSNGGGSMRGDSRTRTAASLRHQTFDSNGPDVRVRGNAWQVYEKYQSLARDATSAGDRVMAESYLQHAEHYFRVTEAIEEATAAEARQRTPTYGSQPEMPQTFFVPEGKGALAQPPSQGQPLATGASGAPTEQGGGEPPMAQAEVTRRTPPPAPNPFFGSDEGDDNNGSNPQTLVAGR